MAEPMSAEYAKSGKAECKGCKECIAKGKLRLGFVGKANFGATAWYHYDCIWNDFEHLKSVDTSKSVTTLVKGADELDKSDKDKLAKDLPKFCKEAASKATETPKTTISEPIATEYAKSAKSTCKGCSKTIAKGNFRVGFTKKANFGATAWYHYDCFWAASDSLKEINGAKSIGSLVNGLDQLRKDDREKLEKDMKKNLKKSEEGDKAGAKRKSTGDSDSSSSTKKKK